MGRVLWQIPSAIVFVSLSLTPAAASTVTVEYYDLGTFSAPTYSDRGLTLGTPNGTLSFLQFNGVGVNNGGIDLGESMDFKFAHYATDVSLFSNVTGVVTLSIEGFGVSGNTLGAFQAGPFANVIDVSAPFGNARLSRFTVENVNAPFGQWQIISSATFTPVPEPSSISLVVIGFGFVGFGLCRKFRPPWVCRHWRHRRQAVRRPTALLL